MEDENNIIPINRDLDNDILGDINQLEAELLEKHGEKPEIVEKKPRSEPVRKPDVPAIIEEPLQPAHGRKPLKGDLIMRIMQMQELVDDFDHRPKSYYTQLRVAQLQEILADLTRRGQAKFLGEDTKNESGEQDPEKVAKKLKNKIPGGKFLFNMNLMLTHIMEVGSIKLEDKIKTNLEGLTDDVIANREALEEALNDIYEENSDWLGDYLSGFNRYMMIMGTLSTTRLMMNKKNFVPRSERQSEEQED